MKLIKREYLNTLIDVMGTPDIKVITGVRRSGKSKLLELFKEYIENNIKKHNIIHINYNSLNFENLKEYHKLNEYIEQRYKKGMNNFVLIDEVQMCEGFEKTINSLHAEEKYDIYITGSNAFLLSSDLATLFTGRTFECQPINAGKIIPERKKNQSAAILDPPEIGGVRIPVEPLGIFHQRNFIPFGIFFPISFFE